MRYLLIDRGLILIPLLFFSFFLNLGDTPLFDFDEGAFGAATWEMLQRGNFITTYLNSELRFDKPILIYWLQALSITVFGLSEWSLRLPSAIAASFWIISVYGFVKSRLGNHIALIASFIGSTSLMVVIIGRAATADALLNLFITLTFLDIYRYFEKPILIKIYQIYFWLGLGFLTKGPIIILISLVVSFLFSISCKRFQNWVTLIFSPLGWLLFIAIAGPWYLLQYIAQDQAFIDGFFLEHNVKRFFNTMEGHGGNFFYYFPVILFILMPFTGWLMGIIWRLRETLEDNLSLFCWLWFFFVFVLFTCSNTQLPHYLLYGVTPLFLLIARYEKLLLSRYLLLIPYLIFVLIILSLPEIFAHLAIITTNPNLQIMSEYAILMVTTEYIITALVLTLVFFMVFFFI